MSEFKVRTVSQSVDVQTFDSWSAACEEAIREALDGALRVVLYDDDGSQYNVYANLVEDDS